MPSITLRDETGQTVSGLSGETLYVFIKTTCPTCVVSWPYLDRIRRLGEGGLSVIGVSQDDPQTTRRFSKGLDVSIRTLYDLEPWVASERLGLTSVPTFLLVRADGTVRDVVVGFQRHKMEDLARAASASAGRPESVLFRPDDDAPAFKPG